MVPAASTGIVIECFAMSHGRRERIAKGVYRDRYGLAGVVKVGLRQKERRFPLSTELHVIQRWREETRIRLRFQSPSGRRGTLEGDATTYLRQVQHLASYKARAIEVRAWVKELGPKLRDSITREDVLRTRVAWLNDVSAKTINNRAQTLRHLFRILDGPNALTPVDHIAPLPVRKTPPMVVSDEKVIEVESTLREYERVHRLLDEKTRARFRVLASTGKRPSEVMRAEPGDVDLERRVWIVRDGKGGYSPGVYLNDDMMAAWRLFAQAKAWGEFSTNSFARTLRGAGWPTGVRPYNLRHTTWIMASERGADLADIQAGAGHKHIATTRKHYVPVRASRMQKLSELIDNRFQWTVPAVVPAEDRSPMKFPRVSRPAKAALRATGTGSFPQKALRKRR